MADAAPLAEAPALVRHGSTPHLDPRSATEVIRDVSSTAQDRRCY